MAHDTSSANLISYRKPDCQRFATNAIHSWLDPANNTSDATRSQPDGDTLTDTTTPRAHGTA